jgi:hypothetical protein
MCKSTERVTAETGEPVNYSKGSPAMVDNSGSLKTMRIIITMLGAATLALVITTINFAVENNNSTATTTMMLPMTRPPEGTNPCEGKKPNAPNVACVVDEVLMTGEQSGTNVTKGYKGDRNTTVEPITVPYYQVGLCPVNVHWHLGAEHYSVGEFDETSTSPSDIQECRCLAGKEHLGFQCTLYDENDAKFTTAYNWQHCMGMEVGQT